MPPTSEDSTGQARTARDDAPLSFDLPRQPLARALYAFSALTGIELIADARLIGGRQSSALRGTMPPLEALQALLRDTGLVGQSFMPGTLILTLSGAPPVVPPEATHFRPPQPTYFTAVQRAVLGALCGTSATVPGDYRLAMKLWIDPAGTVLRTSFLDSTGRPGLDAALGAALARLQIGVPPPVDLPQPVVVLILPQAAHDDDCPAAASGQG
ncbi:MAG TPA: STN domain-containing protein [Aliidongia sp.]|nr:STN domain-containing protein [Aliidongia sp.]